MERRENFGSRIGMLLAMAGSAVGLGNIWRFPYLVGEYGGAAFIFIYLACVFVLSVPIMIAEFVIGRRSQTNAFSAFQKLSGGRKVWKIPGIMTIVTPLLILAFYDVVGGWSVNYLLNALTLSFTPEAAGTDFTAVFAEYIASPWAPMVGTTVFLLLTALIVLGGVKSGIEKFGKIMMPTLFIVVLFISVWELFIPGSGEGLKYLFKPDFSKIDAGLCVSAMGQAFFSLSLGCGTMMTYASYTPKDESLGGSAVKVAVADLLFALMACCAIMPACFAYGINPGSGPGLIFETLPCVFTQMPLGSLVAILFFLAIVVAALTSTVSLYEVGVSYLIEERHLSRRLSVTIIFAVMIALGAVCSLSFGVLSGLRLFGENVFGIFDKLTANILLPLGGLAVCIFVGWILKKEDVREEVTNGGSLKAMNRLYPVFLFLVRFVAPVGILTVFLVNLFA